MSNHSEYLVEAVIIALLNTRTALAGVPVNHFDSDADANAARIVVKATRGNQRKDGPGGYEYSVEVMAKNIKGNATTWETWRREIELAMNTPPSPYPAALITAMASFVQLGDPPVQERDASRDTTDNVHDCTMKFNLMAVEV